VLVSVLMSFRLSGSSSAIMIFRGIRIDLGEVLPI